MEDEYISAEGPIQPQRRCLLSGLTILDCKRVDLCNCFDFPEYDRELRNLYWEGSE